ncbi:MAG: hypothetical protein HQL32_17825 [Planctomycetes bacterium]|nr:hypothetical protein [Planctomycetota bacterium]
MVAHAHGARDMQVGRAAARANDELIGDEGIALNLKVAGRSGSDAQPG